MPVPLGQQVIQRAVKPAVEQVGKQRGRELRDNDPCFELGNIAGECGLDADALAALVTAYYGRPRRSRIARAQLFTLVSRYGWTLWGAIQHASSRLDFDFWSWAMERFEAAAIGFTSPEFNRLLDEAQDAD